MKKQSQVTSITRKNIVDAFWLLYKDKGINQITIKEIMSVAGYNRSTFYEYFSNVQAVLNYLEDSLIIYIKDYINSEGIISYIDNKELIDKIVYLYETNGEYLSVLFSENGDPFFLNKFKAAIKFNVYSNFSKISEKSTIELDLIFEFSITAIISAFTYWYEHKNQISTEEFIKLLRSLLLNGTFYEIQKFLKSTPLEII